MKSITKYRTEYKNIEGYWREYDTWSDENRARREYESMPHKNKRLVRVDENVVERECE